MLFFPFAVVVLIVMILAIIFHARGHKAAACAAIFRHLELITRLNLPLPVALQLAAQTERGAVRRVLFRCGQMTQLGLPLAEALRRAYPRCPGTALSALVVAERANTIPAMLSEWAPRLERHFTHRQFNLTARFGYSLGTWLCFLLILLGVSHFVWPKFATISSDFGVPVSDVATDILKSPFEWEMPRTWTGLAFRIAILSTLVIFFVLLRWMRFRFRRRRSEKVSQMDQFLDWFAWTLSPARSMTRAIAWSQVLPSIRLAAAAGFPLNDAVFQSAQLDVNVQLRRQLAQWAEHMQLGQSPVAAAGTARLPDMLVRWLAAGARDGTFDASLLHAERYYQALADRRSNLLLQILWPVVMFVLACLTGLMLHSILQALVAVIEHTMQWIE